MIQTFKSAVKWTILPKIKDRRTCYFILLILTYVIKEIRNPN